MISKSLENPFYIFLGFFFIVGCIAAYVKKEINWDFLLKIAAIFLFLLLMDWLSENKRQDLISNKNFAIAKVNNCHIDARGRDQEIGFVFIINGKEFTSKQEKPSRRHECDSLLLGKNYPMIYSTIDTLNCHVLFNKSDSLEYDVK